MVELLYGAKDYARIAESEIRQGRPVALVFNGWRRPFVHRAISMYADFDQLHRATGAPRRLSLGVVWRILVAPVLFGLIHQARSSGMSILVRDSGQNLAVRFEPSNPPVNPDARDVPPPAKAVGARAGHRER